MKYDRKLLESWVMMESWEQYLERNGAFGDYVSKELWQHIERQYFRIVKQRIEYCKKLLSEYRDDWFIYYVIAQLCNRSNLDGSIAEVYKRSTRFYCVKAIRKNPNYAPSFALLAEAYSWVSAIGGESRRMPGMGVLIDSKNIRVSIERESSDKRYKPTLFFIERAIKCLKRAIAIDPQKKYLYRLKELYSFKGEELEENKA